MGWVPPSTDTKAQTAWAPPSGDARLAEQSGTSWADAGRAVLGFADQFTPQGMARRVTNNFDPQTMLDAPQAALDYLSPVPTKPVTFMSELKSIGDTAQAVLDGTADAASFGLANRGDAYITSGLSQVIPGMEPRSQEEAYRAILDEQAANNANHPVANLVGQGVGLYASGKGLAEGLNMGAARGLPGAAAAIRYVTPQAATPVGNVLRAASVGAGAGAADQLLRGGGLNGDTAVAALAGGVVGPLAGKVLPWMAEVGSSAVKSLTRQVAPIKSQADAAFVKLLNKLDPDVAEQVRAVYRQRTGVELPVTGALGSAPEAAAAVRQSGEINPKLGMALRESATDFETMQPKLLSGIVADATPTLPKSPAIAVTSGIDNPAIQDINGLETYRTKTMDDAMEPIRVLPVEIRPEDLDVFQNPDIQPFIRSLPSAEREKFLETLNHIATTKAPAAVPLELMEKLRRKVGKARDPADPDKFSDIASNVAEITEAQIPAYKAAMGEFRSNSDYIRLFEHGGAGKSLGDISDARVRASSLTPEGSAGFRAGVKAHLATSAGSSNTGAARTADQMSQNAATRDLSLQALGSEPTRKVAEASTALRDAGASIKAATPATVGGAPDSNMLGHGVAATVAGASGMSKLAIAHVVKLLRGMIGSGVMPDAVQGKVASMLTSADPVIFQQGMAVLKRAGVAEKQLLVLQNAVSAAAGVHAGRFFAPTQQEPQ